MTSIYDIPYNDIKIFLLANNINFKNKDEAYDIAKNLLSNKQSKGHTTSIIEWIMAHNLLINKINIPSYTVIEIDDMSQDDINELSKLLNMKGNNINNIKNILRYLHKLYLLPLPELNEIISSNLAELEIGEINVSKLKYKNVINLLKTHRNKKDIRKFIYNNLDKIIIYNSLYIDFDDNDYNYDYLFNNVNIYNKNILIKIFIDNKEKLKKYYSDYMINNFIKEAKENDDDDEVYIGKSEMYDLVDFTFDLINLNEITLAKRVFDIANELHYYGRSYPYNYDLVDFSIIKDSKTIKEIVNFMGEDEFLNNYSLIEYDDDFSSDNTKKFLENLVRLEKYDLLVKIIQMYVDQNHKFKGKMIYKILQSIKKSILDKNKDLILKYVKFLNL